MDGARDANSVRDRGREGRKGSVGCRHAPHRFSSAATTNVTFFRNRGQAKRQAAANTPRHRNCVDLKSLSTKLEVGAEEHLGGNRCSSV